MHSLLLRSLFPFLLVTSFISINFELCLCQPYSICNEAITCGGIGDISYPFWGVNRPNYCGQPGFELRCLDDVPVINMSNINYRILEMNSSSPRTIKVARQDYWKTLCPSSFANTSINFSLFNYSSGLTNVTFYYGCEVDVPKVNYSSQVCNVNNGSDQVDTGLCKVNVTVPIFSTAALDVEDNPTTLQDAIDSGFKLEIKIDNDQCNSCEGSGGRCGRNTKTGGFTCYCHDQASATICNSTSTEPSGANDQCNSCVESGGRCGLKTTSGGFACFCQDQAYATMCNSTSTEPSGSLSPSWKIGISAGVSGTIVAVICIICISRKRKLMCFSKKDKTDDFDVGAFVRNYGSLTPKRYSYSDVKKMTISFRDKIGKGGYGTVYRGKLPNGCLVAVKVLSDSKGNGEEFINEVASIGRTSHVNVVTLFGFCYERDKRALIYEFMPNGSLDNFIHKQGSDIDNCRLGWKTLSEIAVGVARGLEYLHRGCNTRILHFDIKPQNILLDKDFCPKIADFGLAKLCKAKESIVSMLGTRGTAGYIAPEVFSRSFGGVSHKSDVYSYGMLVLEMVGARKNLDSGVSHTSEMFPHYIYKDLELENANVFGASSEEENEIARKMVIISMWCIQTVPSDRPSISKVVEMLEGPIQSLQIAPKPSLFSRTTAAENSMSTNQQSDVEEMLEGPIQSLQIAPKPSLFSHTTAAENSMSTNQQSDVVEMLEGPIQSLQIAPKPSLFSHTTAAENSMSTNEQSDETS